MNSAELELLRGKITAADTINSEKSTLLNTISELESKKALIKKQPSTSFDLAGYKLYDKVALDIIDSNIEILEKRVSHLEEAFEAL